MKKIVWASCAVWMAAVQAEVMTADLVIYGSSPAAVSAAVKAVDMGLKPVVVSPERHVGGLSVSGLGFTDSGNTSSIGGLARQFYHRIYLAYQEPSAWRWERMEDFKAGGQGTKAIVHSEKTMWTFEPHIAEQVFRDWLAERRVEVHTGEFLDREKGVAKKDGRIVSLATLSGNVYRGRYFIDATYEGDLMAAAGVPYRVGREDCAEFGEHWNGNQVGVLHHKHHFRDWKISPYKVPGDPSSGLCAEIDPDGPGVRGKGDRRVQAYCYRVCMTDDPRNRIPFAKPEGYDRARYELLARCYAKGYGETFAKFDRIANHKTDTNNHGPLNADWLGGSYTWPEASYAAREKLAQAHRDYQMGLYYFIANDPAVPADVRAAMSKWGLAKDEFTDNGGWPYYLYVREGRRMVGAYTMTEHDCLGEPRHPAQGRAYGPVGMGSYSLDSHNVRRYVTSEGYVQNEGDIEVKPKNPYGVDYGAIVPRKADCENLLVPVALSATHMAFGSIRMEPVFMLLGESAATAAAFAARDGRAVQDVDYPELAARLRADGQVIDLPVDAVDVFVGTAGSGHTTPAACRPFALVQAGPDTGVLDWKYCSGYQFADTSLFGFSSSHISGSGCADLGDVLLLPFTRAAIAPREKLPMDKSSETARPGYYSVRLPTEGVTAEMTATRRVGYYRFAYDAGRTPRLLVDLQHGIVVFGADGATNRVLACDARIVRGLVDQRYAEGIVGVDAALQVRSWATRRSFEAVRFSRPATRVVELPKAAPCEKAPRYVFEFAASDEPLEVKVALSTTGLEGARANLAAELPRWRVFPEVREAARAEWNAFLSRLGMKGTDTQRALFYTALYHAAVGPHDITDADGTYRGADDRIHTGVHYGEMSLWDTYRAAHPFLTLACPERVDGFVASLVAQSREQGYLPVWPLRGQETDCMIGNPAVSVIADAYLKGFRGFDAEAAWAEVVKSLENPRPNSRVDLVKRYGYFPCDLVKVESASMTLEDAINCDGAAKFAAALGKAAEAARYAQRARNYRNLFDPATGFIRGRASDGAWRAPFDPLRICNAYALGGDFTEGNAWQYLWLVPHDVPGLVELLGGRGKFLAKLEELFRLPSEPEGQPKLLDVTGLVGQYAHGNEPSQHIAYLFAQTGRPERTQELVREICDRFYTLSPDGICGNEDNGQMSAWYLFACLGFYPVDPVGGTYVLGAPQVPEVTLALPNGKLLAVRAEGLSAANKYVKSVAWNGRPVAGPTVRHADLVQGGALVFTMGAAPSGR